MVLVLPSCWQSCLSLLVYFYLGQMIPTIWIILVILVSLATIVSIVNRSMNPESKVTWLLVAFVPAFGPLLYIMFGERVYLKRDQAVETTPING